MTQFTEWSAEFGVYLDDNAKSNARRTTRSSRQELVPDAADGADDQAPTAEVKP